MIKINNKKLPAPYQILCSFDHFVIKCPGRDLVQGNDGVPSLQLALLQQFFTRHLRDEYIDLGLNRLSGQR